MSETFLLVLSEAASTQPVAEEPVDPGPSTSQVVNDVITGMPDVVADSLPSRYKAPLDSVQQDLLSRKTFSDNTNAKINWAMNLYHDCFFQRCKSANCDSQIKWSNIEGQEVTKANLAFALSCFLSEVRKKDGAEYLGETLYHLLVSIQFYLERTGRHWKLIDSPSTT